MPDRLQRLLAFATLPAVLAVTAPAGATIVERVVAVVGDRAILQSDLRNRAQPFLVQVHQSVPPGAQRSAAISQLYRAVLERLVNEELEQRAAQQSKLAVSAKEVDDAIARVATQNGIAVSQLLAEARRNGLSETDYRDELRRQLLEAKLVNLRLQGRIRVTDEDLRQAYNKLVLEERARLALTPAWIVIKVGSGAAEQKAQRALADRVALLAKRSDFADVARRHSEDPSGASGGILPRTTPDKLPAPIAVAAQSLEAGQTSGPIRIGDRYVILRVVEREASELPNFADARRELSERVYMDKMGHAKKTWLDGLRRQQHVEIRL